MQYLLQATCNCLFIFVFFPLIHRTHPHITTPLSFCINLSITGRQGKGTSRPLSFHVSVDGVSNGCHACPHPQPHLTLSAHCFIIFLSKCLTLLFGLQLVGPRLTCSITFTFAVEMLTHFLHLERQCQISLSLRHSIRNILLLLFNMHCKLRKLLLIIKYQALDL